MPVVIGEVTVQEHPPQAPAQAGSGGPAPTPPDPLLELRADKRRRARLRAD